MRRLRQTGLLAALVLSVSLVPPPRVVQPAPAAQGSFCLEALEPPGATDRAASPTGELSPAQKRAAFAQVAAGSSYGDYRFPVQVTATQTTTVQASLLQAVAGIESDWQQYALGVTNVNFNSDAACDHGLMQLNELASGFLFRKQPSLRSDTRANIAAGASILSDRWNQGVLGPLPLVNDADPDWMINWYYSLSAYNGGPNRTSRSWANNPNCGTLLNCGSTISYFPSRPGTSDKSPVSVTWGGKETAINAFPYQERGWYNLAFPIKPAGTPQWLAAGLGAIANTTAIDTGLRPDDAVFLTRDSSGGLVSFAPNLLLFRHRATPLRAGGREQTIQLEYELPFTAAVTLTLRSRNGQETPLCRQQGQAGWNALACVVAPAVQPGDAYVLRVERGSRNDLVNYYLGQYAQSLSFQSLPNAAELRQRVHLPVVRNAVTPVGLLNSTFVFSDPREGWKPNYWDVQVLVPRDSLGNLKLVTDYVNRSINPLGWGFYAAPLARIDMRQRVHLPAGRYTLNIRVNVQGNDPSSGLTIRTRPATPGPQPWTTVVRLPAQGNGLMELSYILNLSGPTTVSLLATFGPNDRQSRFILREVQISR